jgi:hypothetical protein
MGFVDVFLLGGQRQLRARRSTARTWGPGGRKPDGLLDRRARPRVPRARWLNQGRTRTHAHSRRRRTFARGRGTFALRRSRPRLTVSCSGLGAGAACECARQRQPPPRPAVLFAWSVLRLDARAARCLVTGSSVAAPLWLCGAHVPLLCRWSRGRDARRLPGLVPPPGNTQLLTSPTVLQSSSQASTTRH